MIAPPHGWTARRRGQFLVLEDPCATMSVGYREIVRPLAALDVLIERELALDRTLRVEAIGAPEALVTHEGEYAALVEVTGQARGAPVLHVLGFVLADHYYACAHGITVVDASRAELARTVRELVLGDCHMLGRRRRPFRYRAPRGWTPVVAELDVSWLAPGERPSAAMLVGVALPIERGHAGLAEQFVVEAESSADFTIAMKRGPFAVTTRAGLDGWLFEVDGTTRRGTSQRRVLAVLEDDRYVYLSRLELALDRAAGEHFTAWLDLVHSIEPIPRGAAIEPRAAAGEHVAHWAA